jgi:RNA polymerase sigma-32 factor
MWWIKASIQEYILRSWSLVKMGTTANQKKLFFNLRKAKKSLAWLSAEETRAVAQELGVAPAEVTEMEQRLAARDVAFDPAPDASDEDGAYSPAAYLPAPDADPAVAAENEEWEAESQKRLGHAIAGLDQRSREIIRRRWLADDKATLHELAAEHGVSAERIRQIEAQALRKLRTAMA